MVTGSFERRPAIKKVMVIGCGVMGGGIAARSAHYGYDVTLVDTNAAILSKAIEAIESHARYVYGKAYKGNKRLTEEKLALMMNRIRCSTSPLEGIAGVDLVIEAIPEVLRLKTALFAKLDAVADSATIFASNTSSIPIHELDQSTRRKDRFAGLHFFNPVSSSRLVELIRTEHTSEATVAALQTFVKSLRLKIIYPKDKPSFIVNRLLIPFVGEALAMLKRGDASIEDIDTGIELTMGMPIGPFRVADLVGLDTWLNVAKEFRSRVKGFDTEGLDILEDLVARGHLGRKTGQGFYKYGVKEKSSASKSKL